MADLATREGVEGRPIRIKTPLINLSKADIIRTGIRLGVDYSADVGLAMRLMAEAVAEDPRVLKEPAPTFIFESFGDSALLLQARCFVSQYDDRGPVSSELQQAILRKFREHAVSLPFPQRDIHLKGSDVSEAYTDVVARFLGETRELRYVNYEKPGLIKRLFGGK